MCTFDSFIPCASSNACTIKYYGLYYIKFYVMYIKCIYVDKNPRCTKLVNTAISQWSQMRCIIHTLYRRVFLPHRILVFGIFTIRLFLVVLKMRCILVCRIKFLYVNKYQFLLFVHENRNWCKESITKHDFEFRDITQLFTFIISHANEIQTID